MRYNIFIIAIVLFLMNNKTSYAQFQGKLPYIEVTGEKKIKVTPDIANISIILNNEQGTKEDIDTKEKKLIRTLTKAGIDCQKDLKINSQSSSHEKRNNIDMVKSYTLKLRDVTKLDNIFNDLKNESISNIKVLSFESSNIDKVGEECEKQAIEIAKQKAELLAKSSNCEIGQPIYIDYTINPYINMVGFASQRKESQDAIQEESTITIKDIDVIRNVTIRYLIKLDVKEIMSSIGMAN